MSENDADFWEDEGEPTAPEFLVTVTPTQCYVTACINTLTVRNGKRALLKVLLEAERLNCPPLFAAMCC
jgi:hypothetical protein